MLNQEQTILIVCGPTASGKTSFVFEVAKHLPQVNILSVDSRQVYKGLDIVTGKDIPKDLSPHIHLFGLDIFDPDGSSNLADFLKYASNVLTQSKSSNTPLIIVGGTGLYLKALTQNLSDVVIPQDTVLRSQLDKKSPLELQELLKKVDLQKYSSLNNSDINNPRRLVRAIEIARWKSENSHINQKISQENINYIWIGFMPTKEAISDSIRSRVLERINNGAVDEVHKLLKLYPDISLPIYTSLGVSQILRFIHNEITQEQLVDEWQRAEIDYARRQIVWFKKQTGVIWYDKDSDRKKLALDVANKLSYENEEKTR